MTRSSDLTGMRFGKLVVVDYIGHGKYRCRCDCGQEKDVLTGKLNAGEVKSCGCLKNYSLVGERFGRLLVKQKLNSYTGKEGRAIARYLCECDCGKTKIVLANALRSGATVSCGCYARERRRKDLLKDLTGQKFGRLTVDGISDKHSEKTYWKCHCECGAVKDVRGDELSNGAVRSCGCLKTEKATTHGQSRTRLYHIWIGMRRRCHDPNVEHYQRYGGRGISVCQEWDKSFKTFYEWASHNGYSDEKTIDRIDNDGNYCPENCRWASPKEQANNRGNNVRIQYNGQTYTLAEWSEISGISCATLRHRLVSGRSMDDALNVPVDSKLSHGR